MWKHGTMVSLLVLLSACGVAGPPVAPPALAGNWTLVALDGGGPVAAQRLPTAEFGTDSVSGLAGCNRYRGGFSTGPGGTLSIGPLAATKMACRGPLMDLERAFMQRLQAVNGYRLEDGTLLLDYDTGVERGNLRFRRSRPSGGFRRPF